MLNKNLFLSLVCLATLAIADAPYKPANDEICPSKENCTNIKNECKCWCSHKCGPRDKVSTGDNPDKPVFLMSDKNGNYCYCNQWDLENIDRCQVKDHANNAPNIISDKQ